MKVFVSSIDNDVGTVSVNSNPTKVGEVSVNLGPAGPSGAQGIQGIQGGVGVQGVQGTQGTQGTQGAQGVQGEVGYGAFDAYEQANAAYELANTKLDIIGGTVTGNLEIEGTLITANILPTTNLEYSIGSPENRFKDIYLANSTVYIGDAVISSNGESIIVSSSNGDKIEINATSQTVNTGNLSANVIITGPIAITHNVFSTTSDTPVTIDSFLSSEYTTVKYIIQAKSIDSVHACELFCMHDGVTTHLTEFATLITDHSLGVFNMQLDSGLVELIFEPYNPNNNIINIKLVRQAITF